MMICNNKLLWWRRGSLDYVIVEPLTVIVLDGVRHVTMKPKEVTTMHVAMVLPRSQLK